MLATYRWMLSGMLPEPCMHAQTIAETVSTVLLVCLLLVFKLKVYEGIEAHFTVVGCAMPCCFPSRPDLARCMSLFLIDKKLQKVLLIFVAIARPDSSVMTPGTVAVSAGVSYTALKLDSETPHSCTIKFEELPQAGQKITEPGLNAYFMLPLFTASV